MKLPPKTLHRPSQFDDNVSELTMRDYYSTDHAVNLGHSDTDSERGEQQQYANNSSSGKKLTGGGSSVESSKSDDGGSSKKSQKTKRQVKNRLSKYLTRKGKGEGSGQQVVSGMGDGRVDGNRQVVVVKEVNNGKEHVNDDNNNVTSPSVGNNNHGHSFTSIPSRRNLKSTVADHMVSQMFTPAVDGVGVERAKSWKNEVGNSVVGKGGSSSSVVVGESSSSVKSSSSEKASVKSTATQGESSSVFSKHSKGSSVVISKNGASASDIIKSMEYSSMNVTKERALGYQLEAVGAAAVAVEFGYGEDDGGAIMNDGNVGGDGGQLKQKKNDQRPTLQQQGPATGERGGVVGIGRQLKGKSELFHNNQGEGNIRAGVRMKKTIMASPSPPRSSEGPIKKYYIYGMEEGGGKGLVVEHVSPDRRRTVGGTGEDGSPSKTVKKNLTDLELLGQTVQCVNASLQSSTSTSPSTMKEQGVNNYHISSFKFNPRGCVWYAALTISKADRKLQVPLKVTCHAKDKKPSSTTAAGTSTIYTVKISYYEPPSNTTNWTATFQENFPTMTNISNNNDLISLWVHYQLEITESMEWLRRKLRRWINRSMGEMVVVQQIPGVIVVVPEGKQQHSGGGDDPNVMDRHRQDGKGGVVDDRSRSPLKSPLKRSLKSVDPSTTKTATTCSLSSHSPSRDHQSEEEEACIRARLGEARRELVGKDSDSGNKERGTTTASTTVVKEEKKKATLDRFRGGLVSQHTMRNLLANVSSDEEDEEVEESEEGQETSNAYQPNKDESINVVNPTEGETRGEMSGEESLRNSEGSSGSAAQQAMSSFRSGLMSQNTLKRILQQEEAEEAHQSNDDESNNFVNPAKEEEARGVRSGEESLRNSVGSSGSAACHVHQFRSGLISQNTLKRLLQEDTEADIAQVVEAMYSDQRAEGEIRVAKAGLVSRNTLANLRNHRLIGEVDVVVDSNEASMGTAPRPRRKMSQTESDQQSSTHWEEDNHSQSRNFDKPDPDHEKEGRLRRPSDGEKRFMQRGLVSQLTLKRLSLDSDDPIPIRERVVDEADPARENEDKLKRRLSDNERRLSDGEKRMMQRGLVSQRTQRFLEEVLDDSDSVRERSDDEADPVHEVEVKPKRRMSAREMNLLQRGCASRRSIFSADSNATETKRVPSHINVSFQDDNHSDIAEAEELKTRQTVENKKKTIVAAKKKKVISEDDDEEQVAGMLLFSNNDLHQSKKLDVLTEGQYFLGISMLVYMYSHLRETCRMGHTRCSMHEVDTHSVQSQYKKGGVTKYLSATKTAGSIIRLVIDELEDADEDDADHEIVGGESKEYERQQTAQFRKWIDDSRISQMDEETEKMLKHMKRKVARHRWRRAISAVRLSIRISGGKPPKWENPVVAPGCENCNRFVDMNEMMSETMRKQPKYFKEGSVMNNLIESGIEVVWFSDLSQNDVVYGICVNREEKKIIIVFRGTVNAHNWSMNFKFDTNEYRNPVKNNYPGREDELSLHSGFALYLLRKRKDTGMSKMDEIFEKVEQVGKELAPDGDYNLCITGHSLGGALATLCGFYFGAKPRFAHLSTIYIWTFAAPRVGTQAFIHAYQYLERAGRIRHARFSCTNDIVPLIPFCNFEYDDLQFYKHVGVRIQLHNTGRVGKWRLRNNLDVTYPLNHDRSSEIRRMLTNNIFANLNTPKGFKDFHGLTEHQRRLHFAMTYRKALGSSTLNSDQRRKRIKTLDEYYLIRANITTEGIAEEIVDIRKVDKVKKKGGQSSKWLVRLLVFLLLFTWILLILSITTDVPLECVLVPFTMVLRGIEHLVHLPVTVPLAVYQSVAFRAQHMIHSILVGTRHVGKSSFVARTAPSNIVVMKKIAKERVKSNSSRHAKEIIDAKATLMQEDSSKLQVFERTSRRLYNLASIVDNHASPELTIGTSADGAIPYGFDDEGGMNEFSEDADGSAAELEALEARLNPIQEYATSVSFAPKLDNGLYLVGAGVRKKSVVKVYAVAMYSTPTVLVNAGSSTTLHEAAKTFDSTSTMTSFVLEMVYSAGAEKIAGAIGESVKPRHSGDPSDIVTLESLIIMGVNAIGGQATKGTTFRFDCSEEGVNVSVNGVEQGVAAFKGLGSAFVDVFMDGNSVSPTLMDSSIKTWSSSDYQSLAASLLELASASNQGDSNRGTAEGKADTAAMRRKVESQLKPITEYATSVVFDPKLDEGLYLIGAGVRKKSVVKVYAVALYGSAAVLNAASAPATLRTAARTFDTSTLLTSFVLEMTYSASAEKIGGAIADSVKPRYGGPAADIDALESLIVEGVNKKGGQATKGTTFRFDCSEEGVTVTVDGSVQGTANFANMGGAFVDVFLDDNAVSPTLVSSCMDTWSNSQAKATAASLLELSEPSDGTSSDEQGDEGSSSLLQNAIESNMKAIQEYATSVTFVPKLDDGLYLAGAGVRKKSIVKVYAVAMYSSPLVLQALSMGSSSGVHKSARSFSPASPLTAFVLEMTYSAGAEKIAGAIAESVKPRYNGNSSDINELEALIIKGVNQKGGQASKGTIFRFDCSQDGVRVSVDGSDQGMAAFEGMGGAFVDVFLDDNAVSPSLIDSCVETWSKVSLI